MKSLLSVILIFSSVVFGQTPELEIKIHTYSKDTINQIVSDVQITLTANDSVYKSLKTDSAGNTILQSVPYGNKYTLRLSKPGFIPKTALLNLNYDGTKKIRQFEQPMEVSMEKILEHENFSQLSTVPVIEFYVDSLSGTLRWVSLNKEWLPKTKQLCSEGLTFNQAFEYVSLLENARTKALDQNYIGAVLDLEKSLDILDSEEVRKEMSQLLEKARIKQLSK